MLDNTQLEILNTPVFAEKKKIKVIIITTKPQIIIPKLYIGGPLSLSLIANCFHAYCHIYI